jgi:hypothetical protein
MAIPDQAKGEISPAFQCYSRPGKPALYLASIRDPNRSLVMRDKANGIGDLRRNPSESSPRVYEKFDILRLSRISRGPDTGLDGKLSHCPNHRRHRDQPAFNAVIRERYHPDPGKSSRRPTGALNTGGSGCAVRGWSGRLLFHCSPLPGACRARGQAALAPDPGKQAGLRNGSGRRSRRTGSADYRTGRWASIR